MLTSQYDNMRCAIAFLSQYHEHTSSIEMSIKRIFLVVSSTFNTYTKGRGTGGMSRISFHQWSVLNIKAIGIDLNILLYSVQTADISNIFLRKVARKCSDAECICVTFEFTEWQMPIHTICSTAENVFILLERLSFALALFHQIYTSIILQIRSILKLFIAIIRFFINFILHSEETNIPFSTLWISNFRQPRLGIWKISYGYIKATTHV